MTQETKHDGCGIQDEITSLTGLTITCRLLTSSEIDKIYSEKFDNEDAQVCVHNR